MVQQRWRERPDEECKRIRLHVKFGVAQPAHVQGRIGAQMANVLQSLVGRLCLRWGARPARNVGLAL